MGGGLNNDFPDSNFYKCYKNKETRPTFKWVSATILDQGLHTDDSSIGNGTYDENFLRYY